MEFGFVSSYDLVNRVGRINAGEGKEVLFRSTALEGIKAVDEGQRVAFETHNGQEALSVRIADFG